MKSEPPIHHPALIETIRELYSIPAERLAFVDEGECGVSYAVWRADGARQFLKMWPATRIGQSIRANLEYSLPLTWELSTRGFLPEAAAPIPTRAGALSGSFAEYALALFPFAEGMPLTRPDLPDRDGVLARVASAMARLHRSTPLLRSTLPPRSAFAVSFDGEMRGFLAALEEIGDGDTPGKTHLRRLLLPRRTALLERLDRLAHLREEAVREEPARVLCHTDMGGNNVLARPDGSIAILDWDDLILAPAEHDLAEYRGPGFAAFLGAYRAAGGVTELSAGQFTFYLLRRYLGDLTDWMARILTENNPPAQDASDLRGIAEYCLPSLDGFEVEMGEIGRVTRG